MAKIREIKTLSMQEAMDNLAAVVGINLENPPKIGIIQRHRLVTDDDRVGPHEVVWLSAEGVGAILDIMDMTFYTIHHHLINLVESKEVDWEDPKARKGVEAMFSLSVEAARILNEYLAFRTGKELETKVEERPAYQELYFFYHNRFSNKLSQTEQELWRESWAEGGESQVEFSQSGLKDFEAVKRDLQYELFSISDENGKPYFNPALIRNIKVACFDAGKEISFEEDPLLRVRAIEDRDLQASADQFLRDCEGKISDFCKLMKRLGDNSFAQHLNMALMALFLAANPRNLIQNTIGKSCLQYFQDFQEFLRRAMNSDEYQKYVAYPPSEEDKVAHTLLNLTHALSLSFFYRLGGVRQEIVGLIHRCMRKGEEADRKTAIQGDTLWNRFLIDDEKFRAQLSKFPNGPLFKILDQVREETPEIATFDPLIQKNLPQKLFTVTGLSKPLHVLRFPCPTRQGVINKVTIAEEFRGFLRAYASKTAPKKHLMIHLQDRTSWEEYARCQSMEKLQNNAEFNGKFVVITLPKHTDFYYQISEYLNTNSASDFLTLFKQQLASFEECGFFFPSSVLSKNWSAFTDQALMLIHSQVFGGEKELNRQKREDFIEIFYQLAVLKCIELTEPDSISFTCKDAIDTGAAALASFFSTLQLLNGDMKKEADFLRFMLYAPALFIRERGIDPERLSRTLSSMETFDEALNAKGSKLYKELSGLFGAKFLESLKAKHL